MALYAAWGTIEHELNGWRVLPHCYGETVPVWREVKKTHRARWSSEATPENVAACQAWIDDERPGATC